MIFKIWSRLSSLGVDYCESHRSKRVTKLVNQFNLIILCMVLISTVYQIVKHLLLDGNIHQNTLYMLFTMSPLIIIFVFHHYGKIELARFTFLIYNCLIIFVWSLLTGNAVNVNVSYLILPVPAVILFERYQQQLLIIVICCALFTITEFHADVYGPLLDDQGGPNVKYFNFMACAVVSFVMLRFFTSEIAFTEQKLKQKNEDLDNFTHVASHDLKEPLRTIENFSSLIQKKHSEELNPDVKKYVDIIKDSSSRMAFLINDLMLFATTGTLTETEEVDLNEVLESVKKDLDKKIWDTKAKIYSSKLPKLIANKTAMFQLFQNLISNGIKFQPKENNQVPEINIVSMKSGNKHIVTFEDNGIGIPEDKLDRVFESFSRLNQKTEYEGTGLGLSTVKKLIDLHNGEIGIESKLGKGTKILVSLSSQL